MNEWVGKFYCILGFVCLLILILWVVLWLKIDGGFIIEERWI